jgi:hypothetical protein
MEIIAIEKRTFEQMMQSFASFAGQVKNLCGNGRDNKNWMDNEAVCKLLTISQRTLQSYRDNDILPYSQIGYKCYYRAADVEQFINEQQTKIQK